VRKDFYAEDILRDNKKLTASLSDLSVLQTKIIALNEIKASDFKIDLSFKRTFEGVSGTDIVLEFGHFYFRGEPERIGIEVKPSVGDDYPAVLRKIRARQRPDEGNHQALIRAYKAGIVFCTLGACERKYLVTSLTYF
jgi:hypothetical protein